MTGTQASRRRAAVALAGATLLAGCSAAEVAYRNADWLAMQRLERYLDLDTQQRATLAGNLEARLEHHRAEELPALARGLEEARDMVARGLGEQQARELAVFVRQLYVGTAHGVVRDVAPVLVSLDDEQIDHLQSRFESENEVYRERHLDGTPDERAARRLERVTERLEEWLGPLRSEQQALLERTLPTIPSLSESWLAFSEQQQSTLLALLRRDAPLEQVVSLLDVWWIDTHRRPPAYRERLQTTVEGWIELATLLDRSLEPDQRARVVERLDDYRRTVSRLAGATAMRGRRALSDAA